MKMGTETATCLAAALALAAGVVGAIEHVPPEFDARIVHVSPADGNPFGTAKAAIRGLRDGNGGRLPRGGVIVVLADGLYRLDAPVEFGPGDSGSADCPIVYRAAHAGKAVLSGAVGLEWRRLSDESTLPESAALLPEGSRAAVLTAPLPAGQEAPSFFGASCYMQDEQLERPEYQYPLALYSGERRLPTARWPNDGCALTDELIPPIRTGWIHRSSRTPVFGARGPDGSRPNLRAWVREPDLHLHGEWKLDYVDTAAKPESIDPERGLIAIDRRYEGQFGVQRGAQFIAFNAISELDRPGEWALDAKARRLYLMADGAERPRLARSHGLIRCRGVTDVEFEGLTLECSRGHAVVLRECRDVVIRKSVVRGTTGWGIRVEGGRNCRVEGCDLYDLGEGGVWLEGGTLDTLTRSGHVCDNCHIRDYAVLVWNYNPGVSLFGCGNAATHNLIHHAPHQACFFYGAANRFAWNVVHDVCRFSNDCGAVYSYNTHSAWSHRGNEILYNVIHCTRLRPGDARLRHKEPDAHQRDGIYLDAFTSGTIVRGNIVSDTTHGVFSSGGQDNLIERNLVVGASNQAIRRWNLGLREGKNPFHHVIWGKTNDSDRASYLMKPLQDKRELYGMAFWRERYPKMLAPLAFADPALGHSSHYCRIVNNVCAGPAKGLLIIDEKVTEGTTVVEGNLEFAGDPGFVDYAGMNWELREDSPARRTLGGGTRFAEMGLYESVERASPAVKFGEGVSRPVGLPAVSRGRPGKEEKR